jgi:fucose permease
MSADHGSTVTSVARRHSPALMVVVIAYLVFIFLGIPDGMLGIAWPSMRGDFGLALGQMGVLLTASTAGFLITSFSAGRLITVLGVSRLLIITTILRGLALIGMGLAPSWLALVAAFLVFGLASGGIDGGLNTYFAMNFSPRLMNWLHASFGLGATLGPILMTVLLSLDVAWRWGYIAVGLLQAALALLIFIRADAWELRSATHSDGAARKLEKISYRATLRRPIVWVNILIFFLYSGTEITAGNWMYTIFTESRGVAVTTAGFWVSVYWASFTAGRIVFGFVANRFKPIHATRAMIAVGALSATLIWWNPADLVSFLALALMGFAMSPIFPLLMSTTPARLGVADATNAIGFQVAGASIGIAVLPGLAGALAERTSLEVIPPFILAATILMFVLHEVAVRRHR